MRGLPPAAVLMDIEGTTTPPSFVRGVLLPYASRHLVSWVLAHAHDGDVAAALAEVRAAVPGQDEAATLTHWMQHGVPAAPLRRLQGLLWAHAFAEGALGEPVYADVAPALRRWSAGGLRLFTYSAASAVMQRLLFAHAADGNLAMLFGGFFDTRVGSKREPDSYVRLAIAMAVPTTEVLFLSAAETELDAAAVAGMRTCQMLRPDGGAEPAERHLVAGDFPAIAGRMGLPAAA
jgi:enolase-phosphatase E1